MISVVDHERGVERIRSYNNMAANLQEKSSGRLDAHLLRVVYISCVLCVSHWEKQP